MKADTICAIATTLSDSGIGIIRISGEEAIDIADKMFFTKSGKQILKSVKSHTIHYGFIKEKDEILDEVMVSVMLAPKSYTTEDTVEINCHGGIIVMKKIQNCALKCGARLAEPGEFTKRAFLNGRIDLSEAEAVMDLIHSKNELARKSSISQINGSVKIKISELREKVLYEIAYIESALDDPEHISLDGYHERLTNVINILSEEIEKLILNGEKGKILKNGIQTVIVGKPNVGKSSLLNLLLGEEKAIVTDIAGTTRDVLEEQLKIGDINLNIVDTAGIRDSHDVVEKIGVEKARKYAKDAELVIYVIDASVALDVNDYEIFNMIQDKKCIILLNKTDLLQVVKNEEIEDEIRKSGNENIRVIKTSTKNNQGMEELVKSIQDMFFSGEISFQNEIYLTNTRHVEELRNAKESILMVRKSLEDDMPEDFYSIDLMNIYSALGRIIGAEVSDDLVNEIFSKFCMGK